MLHSLPGLVFFVCVGLAVSGITLMFSGRMLGMYLFILSWIGFGIGLPIAIGLSQEHRPCDEE